MKNVRCDSQFHRADPEYPFQSEWNENGGITYYAPIEVDSAEALITLNHDDTCMSVYNPSETLLKRIRDLASANGLFLWKPEVKA